MVLWPRLVSTESLNQQRHLGSQILLFCNGWNSKLELVALRCVYVCPGAFSVQQDLVPTSLWALVSTDCTAMSRPMVGGRLRECSLSYRLWQGEDSQPEKALRIPLDHSGLNIPEHLYLRTSPSKQGPKLRRMCFP